MMNVNDTTSCNDTIDAIAIISVIIQAVNLVHQLVQYPTISARLGNVKYSTPSDDKSVSKFILPKIRLNMMNVNDNEWMD